MIFAVILSYIVISDTFVPIKCAVISESNNPRFVVELITSEFCLDV